MKQLLRKFVVSLLRRQLKSLRKKRPARIVAIVGETGKTSTKHALAQALSASLHVQSQPDDEGSALGVFLGFFGRSVPESNNPFTWLRLLLANQKYIQTGDKADVVIIECDTGVLIEISKSLTEIDILVVTAPVDLRGITARQVFYNVDLVADSTTLLTGSLSYGIKTTTADFYLANIFHSAAGLEGDIKHAEEIYLHVSLEVISETQLYSLLAAVVVGRELGLKTTQILSGLSMIRPLSGRLRRLRGINASIIIDDSYNARASTVVSGIEMIHKLEAPQRIVVLGGFDATDEEYKAIAELCQARDVSLVITIGETANARLAPIIEASGGIVKKCQNPYDAGEYLQPKVEPQAIVFVTGGRDSFSEEVVRSLLADPEDADKLVRQSESWRAHKQKQFKLKTIQ